jgi:hypothetical protein
MICASCQLGAAAAERVRETGVLEPDPHAQCPGGTWCDCQHVTRPGLVLTRKEEGH